MTSLWFNPYMWKGSSTLFEYPTSAMTANTSALSGGTYIASASRADATYPAWLAFNKVVENPGWYTNGLTYNGTTGAWTGTGISLNGINGDWIKLRLPSAIVLKSYSLTNRDSANAGQAPWKYALLGSNDDSTWTIVDDKRTNGLPWTGTSNQILTINDFTNNTAFLFYAIVVTFTAAGLGLGNGVVLSMSEWRLFAPG